MQTPYNKSTVSFEKDLILENCKSSRLKCSTPERVRFEGITVPDCVKKDSKIQLDCNINIVLLADYIEHLTISQSSP